MKFNKRERILGIIIVSITLVLFLVTAYFFMKPKLLSEKEMDEMFVDATASIENKSEEKYNSSSSKNDYKNIILDIDGAVNKPGVYYMKNNQVLNDLINEAGGLKQDADLSKINRAEKLVDNKKFYIPYKGEENVPNFSSASASSEEEEIINLNTASKEQLKTLPGIGDTTAEKIIKYREKVGTFKKIEDLMNVDGIGEGKYNKIKDLISV